MRASFHLLAAVALIATASSGCVSKKKYNELQSQYDDLSGRYSTLQQSEAGLRVNVDDLEESVEHLRRSNEYLGSFYADLLSEFRGQLEDGEVEVIVYPDRMSLAIAQDVGFKTGSATLTDVGDETVQGIANLVERHPDRRFMVEGHTDSVPIHNDHYKSNWELGAARAVSVVDQLIEAGVPSDKLAATTYADTQPLVPNDSKENNAINRRVEIAFQPTLEELPGHRMLVDAAEKVTYAKDAGTESVPELGPNSQVAATAAVSEPMDKTDATTANDAEIGTVNTGQDEPQRVRTRS
jgi:chemotaxis protein MotB